MEREREKKIQRRSHKRMHSNCKCVQEWASNSGAMKGGLPEDVQETENVTDPGAAFSSPSTAGPGQGGDGGYKAGPALTFRKLLRTRRHWGFGGKKISSNIRASPARGPSALLPVWLCVRRREGR